MSNPKPTPLTHEARVKSGLSTAAKMTAEERSERARKAAASRWINRVPGVYIEHDMGCLYGSRNEMTREEAMAEVRRIAERDPAPRPQPYYLSLKALDARTPHGYHCRGRVFSVEAGVALSNAFLAADYRGFRPGKSAKREAAKKFIADTFAS